MYDVIRGDNALYFPTSRQRKWGGMWEGVVKIVSGDETSLHVCAVSRDDADEAARDAILDAVLLANGKTPVD